MKEILFIRHAKSDWSQPGQKDFDRPLNARGRTDAPQMAARIFNAGLRMEHLYCSTALRTRETAVSFLHSFNLVDSGHSFEDQLYHAPLSTFVEMIRQAPRAMRSMGLLGHNPGLQEAVEYFIGRALPGFPTAAVARVQFPGASWADIQAGSGQLTYFGTPKNKLTVDIERQ